jgi:hypothetical protein
LLRFTLREPDRGRRRFRNREWWCSAHLPRFWNRTCSPDCRVGTTYEWEDESGELRVSTRDHREDCPRAPRYLGHVAKGWWYLWTVREGHWRWESRFVFAVGGEDNMAQLTVQLPILGLVAAGVAVPRSWTTGWIYQRRELGLRLDGLWPTLLVGYDDSMADMHDYYMREYPKGTERPAHVNGVKLWPGWQLRVKGWRWGRLKNRLLGAVAVTDTTLKVYDPVTLTLPEGDYVGKVTFYRSLVKRPRWRARRDEVYGKFESEEWMPWPDKGENSWDCGDTGTKEHTVTIGPGRMSEHEIDGSDVAKVISGAVAYVLRMRARYSRWDWKPEGVGVMRD